MAWNTPLTFIAGTKHAAAALNAGIRDCLRAIGDPWTAFSASWTGTIGNGTITSTFLNAGKLVHFRIEIVGGSTTNWTSGATLTLPTSRNGGRVQFLGIARVGSSSYPIYGDCGPTSSTVTLRTSPTTAGAAMRTISATVPDTFGTGDALTITGTYEAT